MYEKHKAHNVCKIYFDTYNMQFICTIVDTILFYFDKINANLEFIQNFLYLF